MIRSAIVPWLRRSPLTVPMGRPLHVTCSAMHHGTVPKNYRNDAWNACRTFQSSSLSHVRRMMSAPFWGGSMGRTNSLYTPVAMTHPWTVVPTHPSQVQQIRTYARRKKRKKLEQYRAWKADQKRKGIKYPARSRDKDRPVDFRTQITRLLTKATRGAYTKWFLREFVRAYPSYSREQRYTDVIPYLSGSYRQTAFRPFFARILTEITVENNHGTSGFVWMMQFREELMDLIYLRVEELPTLDRKVKLMRQRLLYLDNMKKQIRKDMGAYIFTLCSQPLPKLLRPVEPLVPDVAVEPLAPDVAVDPPDEVVEAASIPPEDSSAASLVDDEFADEVPPEYRTGPPPPPTPPLAEIPRDSEWIETDEPRVLGCLRRLQYSELSIPFLRRFARAEPLLAARFRGEHKRVYGWFQDETRREPDVVIYAALLDAIPQTMEEILVEKEEAVVEEENPLPQPKVAVFYGATVLHRALEKTGIAEYCVRPIIEMLRDDADTPSTIDTFSTLSPICSFRNWLLNNGFEDDITLLVVNEFSDDFLVLQQEWDCPNDQVFRRMKSLLARNYESYVEGLGDNAAVATAINNLLLRCASSYIVKGKTPVAEWRCNPLELSTRYHVAQGASVFRLNLAAEPTEAGWNESFGIRTNFIYDIKKMESNREKFKKSFSAIDFHENVTQYVPKPRKLQLTKEQRERWIPEDPVRKKIIKLSQNGKLFHVPLYGPPTFGRKRTMHPTLVPRRERPPSPLPPPVPTVGVSGLSIMLKVPPLMPVVPSYIARTVPGGIRQVGEGARLQKNGEMPRRERFDDWPEEVEFGHVEGGSKRREGKQGNQKTKSRS